jgi:hypothetical protein
MYMTKWTFSGYYVKDETEIKLEFKSFTCPTNGGDIVGHSTDGKTAKGKIERNRKLVFTLEDSKGDKLYFDGKFT